jgi:metallo-beta-lactamase family protein
MELSFWGADRQVTGSCHQIEVNGKKCLIDCGMQQGGDEIGEGALPFDAKKIDYVIVTHAHIDHSGRLPLLVKNGFAGKIFATGATCNLMGIMLRDSAKIQEFEAEWKKRKGKRAGDGKNEPLYGMEDAEKTLTLFVPCKYGEIVQIDGGIKAEFRDAGHLLGSASVRITATEAGQTKTIVFSGDIGNKHQPIIRNPQYFHAPADYVLTESTYGDRLHKEILFDKGELAGLFDAVFKKGGNVVIPSFAVGRTQELLYSIREIKEEKLVQSIPDFPVYVDSPLALEATGIYDKDLTGYADEETLAVLRQGFRPLAFPNLNLSRTTEESIALNRDSAPKVIISASGMCEAGRIRHHLKHNLWRPECAVVFVGYQANGTLGRMLLDGIPQVKLFGETIAVKCSIHNFAGLSAHADKDGLLEWIGAFAKKPKKVFVVHGEEETCLAYTGQLKELGYDALAPNYEMAFDLLKDDVISEGVSAEKLVDRREPMRMASPAYRRLEQTGDSLVSLIRSKKGMANRELSRLADQLAALMEDWEK